MGDIKVFPHVHQKIICTPMEICNSLGFRCYIRDLFPQVNEKIRESKVRYVSKVFGPLGKNTVFVIQRICEISLIGFELLFHRNSWICPCMTTSIIIKITRVISMRTPHWITVSCHGVEGPMTTGYYLRNLSILWRRKKKVFFYFLPMKRV